MANGLIDKATSAIEAGWQKIHDSMQKDWDKSVETEQHKTRSTCPEHTTWYAEREKRKKSGDPLGTGSTGQ
jgi:hypothetical protein